MQSHECSDPLGCRKCKERARGARRREDPAYVERQKTYHKTWLQRDGVKARKNQLARESGRPSVAALKAFFASLKDNQPCMDCRQSYPHYVMDWDHRPGETKLFGVGTASGNRSRQAVLDEITKCDLVCSNCHRERTYRRRVDAPIE